MKNKSDAPGCLVDAMVGHFAAWVEKVEGESALAEIKLKRERLNMATDSRRIREHARKSMREVARRMGVSAMFLSDLERGNRNWTIKQIQKWKEAMK